MAKAARKAPARKAPKKPVKASPKKAAKAKRKPARQKPRAKPARKAPARKLQKVRKPPMPRKKAFNRKAAKTAGPKAKKAPAPKIAPEPKPQTAPRQLMVVEERKPPMSVSTQPPSPISAPQTPRMQPSPEPPHLDASKHDDGPLAVPLAPALDLLPEWEDRLRLKRAIFEDGLTFFSLARGCPEYHEASIALSKSGKDAHEDMAGYFIVCLKDRTGNLVGAMDGHMLGNSVMLVGRSFVRGEKRREMHILLYSAALSGHTPEFVLFSSVKAPFSAELAAKLILLGRGLGFSAIPFRMRDRLVFIRRVRRELDPISSGQELARALSGANALIGTERESAEIQLKGVVPLVPLPTSPDSREHLHELRDVVQALELGAPDLESVLETLRSEYLLQRKDLTPEILS